MAEPVTRVEVAFHKSTDGLSTDLWWSDVSEYVKSFSGERGRSYEMDAVEAGTASVVFDNEDGRFTPGLATSPYFPNVKPRKNVRVTSRTGVNLLDASLTTGGDTDEYPFSIAFNFPSTAAHPTASRAKNFWTRTTPAHNGKGALRFDETTEATARSIDATTANAFARSQFIPLVTAGAGSLTLSFYAANLTAASQQIYGKVEAFQFTAGAPVSLGTFTGATATLATGGAFARVTASGTLPALTTHVRFTLHNALSHVTNNRLNLGLDSFRMEHAAAATAYDATDAVFPLFYGEVERWPVRFESAVSEVSVPITDSFLTLARASMYAPVRQAIVGAKPNYFWPLNDPADATTATELIKGVAGTIVNSPFAGYGAFTGEALPAYGDDGGGSFRTYGDSTTIEGAHISTLKTAHGESFDFTAGEGFTVAGIFRAETFSTPDIYSSVHRLFGFTSPDLPKSSFALAVQRDPFDPNDGNATGISIEQSGGGAYAVLPVGLVKQGVPFSLVCQAIGAAFKVWINGTLVLDTLTNTITTANAVVSEFILGGEIRYYATDSIIRYENNLSFSNVGLWFHRGANKSPVVTSSGDLLPDALKRAAYTYPVGVSQVLTETATIAHVLDSVPGARAGLGVSSSLLDPLDWSEGTSALETASEAAESALGVFFASASGVFRYRGRTERYNLASRLTFSESSGLGVEKGLLFESDELRVVNDARVTRLDGTAFRAFDQTAIDDDGPAVKEYAVTLADNAEAESFAWWRVNTGKDALIRCDQVTVKASAGSGILSRLLPLEIGDKITLSELPTGAPYVSAEFFIEGINWSLTIEGETEDWVLVLQLSPSNEWRVWCIEDATYGAIDSTNALAH